MSLAQPNGLFDPSPAAPAAAPVSGPGGPMLAIDLVHLSRQTFGDKLLETELLRMFTRQARAIGAAIDPRAGSADRTVPTPADMLHTLVGSSRAIGAPRVAEVALRIETQLRLDPGGGRPTDADAHELLQAIDDACGFIARVL